ncbi:DUF4249 domain-containing protein [Hymenobacter canadensis]|uniref:DUF4249 domain-containing protein n=1 Tax=Hymenobacter canadensis TaxID=2999067 RepID=A0ABY7LUM9_9BACT|nr:DUF4249 domain-containing protein [Hymenobacter canadensis]WBA44104.1 DUF4249 domain-containing protein [Hymenobacter canadensis]
MHLLPIFARYRVLPFLALVGLLTTACEDVIDVDLPTGDPLLAVEGGITDQPGPYTVTLTRTAAYFNAATPPPVTGARLVLRDEASGAIDTLRETTPGRYQTTGRIRGRVGGRYTLRIGAEGEEYAAETSIPRTAEIDSLRVQFQEESLGRDAGDYVLYYGPELPGEGDYYRLKVFINGALLNEPNDLRLSSDRLTDGRYINGRRLTTELYDPGTWVRFELNALPRDYHTFLDELGTQVTNGGLFANPPANVRTNVRNARGNEGPPAVGYFAGYTVRQDSVRLP